MLITFYIYKDAVARHMYFDNGDIKYDVIALFPDDMRQDVAAIVEAYAIKPLEYAMFTSLPIKESSFAYDYGLK